MYPHWVVGSVWWLWLLWRELASRLEASEFILLCVPRSHSREPSGEADEPDIEGCLAQLWKHHRNVNTRSQHARIEMRIDFTSA